MSGLRPSKTVPSLIEPEEAAKDALYVLLAELDGRFQNPIKLRDELQSYAADMDLDFFSHLANSTLPRIQLIGHQQLMEAMALAASVAGQIREGILLYIGGADIPGALRKTLLAQFVMTKEQLGPHYAAYQAMDDREKTNLHFAKIQEIAEGFIGMHLLRTSKGMSNETISKLDLKDVERHSKEVATLRTSDGFVYDIPSQPKIIGIAYARFAFQQILIKHNGLRNGNSLESVEDDLHAFTQRQRRSFAQPNYPDFGNRAVKTAMESFFQAAPGRSPTH